MPESHLLTVEDIQASVGRLGDRLIRLANDIVQAKAKIEDAKNGEAVSIWGRRAFSRVRIVDAWIDIDAATKQFSCFPGAALFANIKPNDEFRFQNSAHAGNNAVHLVTEKISNDIIVCEKATTLVTESGNGDEDIFVNPEKEQNDYLTALYNAINDLDDLDLFLDSGVVATKDRRAVIEKIRSVVPS